MRSIAALIFMALSLSVCYADEFGISPPTSAPTTLPDSQVAPEVDTPAKYVGDALGSLTTEQRDQVYKDNPGFEDKSLAQQATILKEFTGQLAADDPTYCDEHPYVKPPCGQF